MKYAIDTNEHYAILSIATDKLDTLSAPDIKAELVLQSKQGQKNLVVDMSQARYCDSNGLSALLVGNRLCKEAGGTFVLCSLQPSVEKLVQISQLNSVFHITPTRDEAIDFVMLEEMERELGGENSDQ